MSERYLVALIICGHSEAAERREADRDRVEVGLVRLGVLDMDDAGSSPKLSRREVVKVASMPAVSALWLLCGNSKEDVVGPDVPFALTKVCAGWSLRLTGDIGLAGGKEKGSCSGLMTGRSRLLENKRR